ncbi:MAG TPA: amino acid permease [Gemmatimonadota bacterium]|nr:amino acid permease [Gemmatimonadota bacterium]
MPLLERGKRLSRDLTLADVFAISTGAMFSSGFFLLPGLAAAKAGPAVVLAYLLAGLLVVPAVLSKAELCTAMPRAGGTYYFLDRSMGPMVGTVGGLGTWIALVLKSSFALIGMGAYLGIFAGVPIRPLAVGLTVVFVGLNLLGARETSTLQRALVVVLLAVLVLFVVEGLVEVGSIGPRRVLAEQFSPFLPFGTDGLLATVGLVFVSFVGITKVASIPEEVQDPDRNIPLGMGLSLLTAVTFYVLGVGIMVAVLSPEELHHDLTPVATAGREVLSFLPEPLGLVLVVGAAMAAFAAMANAGVMTASRYPLALARDRMLPASLQELNRFDTPGRSIVVTGALMVLCLLTLDVMTVAKLASALQLLIFGMVNLAVIVMRESRLEAYDPGFRSPAYPWVQIVGFLAPMWLIVEIGPGSALFTAGVIVAAVAWYRGYARSRVEREGAMYHVFARLGRRQFEGLDPELRQILKEKGLREADPFERVVAGADVLELGEEPASFEEVADAAARRLAREVPASADALRSAFLDGTRLGVTPVSHGAALPHARLRGLDEPRLVLVRAPGGVEMGLEEPPAEPIRALFFLASPRDDASLHLRILAEIAGRVDDEGFGETWLSAGHEAELKEVLLRDDRFLTLVVDPAGPAARLAGRRLAEAGLPDGALVALVRREGRTLVARPDTVLEAGDRLTILGEPDAVSTLRERYVP